jgi:type I restriction enzyme, S subunit
MNAELLLQHYERIADAPDAIARLRRFILDLAVRGKLVPQDPKDEPAAELLKRIAAEKARLVKAGEFREPGSFVQIERKDLPFVPARHWVWVRLIDVARPSYGFAFASGQFNSSKRGMPLIRIRDISNADTEAYYEGDYDPTYLVTAGDYLVGMDGDFNLRRWNGIDGLLNQRVMRINGWRCSVDSEFIKLPLQFVLNYLHGETSLTTVKHLSAKQVNGIEIPLPPLAEQHRIVAKVDELMALCDRLEAARAEREATRDRLAAASLAGLNAPDPAAFQNDARFALDALPALTMRPDQINRLRLTILNLAVRGKLVTPDPKDEPAILPIEACETRPEEVPTGWRYTRLVNLLAEDTRNGYSRRPDDAADGTPILRISAGTVRRDGVVAEEEHKLISGIDPDARLQYGLKPGDLLACRFNGNKAFVGRFAIFNDYLGIRPIYPDKLIRVRVARQLVLPLFLQIAGDTDIVRREVEAACATTVGNWGISASNLKEIRFPLPPLAEQYRIVAKVDALMALCDRLEASLADAAATRRRLLDALLAEALAPAEAPGLEEVA